MIRVIFSLFAALCSCFRDRTHVHLENLALRHQLAVLQRSMRRPKLRPIDRWFWVVLSRIWVDWRDSLLIVKPKTVIGWHRTAFRKYWTWKSRARRPGRPAVGHEIRKLIRQMSRANPLWGAPRIHGELLKLGIDICQTTVDKYMPRRQSDPSPTWKSFLNNHLDQTVALDFFVVPTLTFRLLFVLVILAHDRRRVLHFNVTAHPTAAWTRQQLVEAFPWDSAPRYLLRDRDSIYGAVFKQEARNLDIEEVVTAYRSPWQNPFVERVIGSIRRECADHIVVLNEVSLRRTLKSYFLYYAHSRTHLALEKDSPQTRAVQLPGIGPVVELPQVGGLHHRYERRAA